MPLTDAHMALLPAADALGMPLAEVERLVGELVNAGMLAREPRH